MAFVIRSIKKKKLNWGFPQDQFEAKLSCTAVKIDRPDESGAPSGAEGLSCKCESRANRLFAKPGMGAK